MKVVDIANEIYIDAGSPTNTSIPAIAYWIRGKIGTINNLLFEDFIINDGFEIVDGGGDEIPIEAVAIIKQMYRLYDYEVQIRNNMNALATDSLLEVTDNFGGAGFRRINKNEVSKTLITIRKDEINAFNNLVTAYRMRGTSPVQVAGDDTQPAWLNPFVTYIRTI